MSNEAKELTLLPCPFCGSEASFGTIKYDEKTVKYQKWGQDTFHTVNCVKCGAGTEKIVGARTQEDAAGRWNRRTPDPQTTALRSVLETIRNMRCYLGSQDGDAALLRDFYGKKLEQAIHYAETALAASEPSPDPIREAATALVEFHEGDVIISSKYQKLLTALKAALSGKETKDARD